MKRAWIIIGVGFLVVASLTTWYFYSAWHLARETAVAIAAGEQPAPFQDAPWALGTAVPHSQLSVQTEPGWQIPSRRLVVYFVITNTQTQQSVEFGVVVEFTTGGWNVIGAGSGG